MSNKHILITDVRYIELPDTPDVWPREITHMRSLPVYSTESGDVEDAMVEMEAVNSYQLRFPDSDLRLHVGIPKHVSDILTFSAEAFDNLHSANEKLKQDVASAEIAVSALTHKLEVSEREANYWRDVSAEYYESSFWSKIGKAIKEVFV